VLLARRDRHDWPIHRARWYRGRKLEAVGVGANVPIVHAQLALGVQAEHDHAPVRSERERVVRAARDRADPTRIENVDALRGMLLVETVA
jgi:hypothetical protein